MGRKDRKKKKRKKKEEKKRRKNNEKKKEGRREGRWEGRKRDKKERSGKKKNIKNLRSLSNMISYTNSQNTTAASCTENIEDKWFFLGCVWVHGEQKWFVVAWERRLLCLNRLHSKKSISSSFCSKYKFQIAFVLSSIL